MAYKYADPFIGRLSDDIAAIIEGRRDDAALVREKLFELCEANCPEVADYWNRTERGRGVPDTAFRGKSIYLFPDQTPARTFRTSGTTGVDRGSASYSPLGLELMNASILENARRHMMAALDRPAIVRFVPSADAAPDMVMAYGMELIAKKFGDARLSASVIESTGIRLDRLRELLDAIVSDGRPAVLIGGSFAFVNVCDTLKERGLAWQLPARSRMIDAGGFKGRSRVVTVDGLRTTVAERFGISPECCVNLFGMTELASQLYDGVDQAVGTLGERPKAALPFVEPRVRDPRSMSFRTEGQGLLEVIDLCVIDRPCSVLTGDFGIAAPGGVAITGRVERSKSRGCSLTLDDITTGGDAHV